MSSTVELKVFTGSPDKGVATDAAVQTGCMFSI